MYQTSPDQLDTANINFNLFVALSNISLTCMERLAKLNFETTQQALDKSATISSSMLAANEQKAATPLQRLMPDAATQNTLDYFKQVQEIAADSQKEYSRLMSDYLAMNGKDGAKLPGWSKFVESFKGLGPQISEITESNQKAMAQASESRPAKKGE